MSELEIKILDVQWHRNGISGTGFFAVLFREKKEGLMVATLFDQESYCAVYQVDKLAAGDIRFGSNSWRGDSFESVIRPLMKTWLEEHGTGRIGPFAAPVISDDDLTPLPEIE